MISEIKIILEEGSSNKAKGNCFETLIRNLLNIHQYSIRGNINFSGMEIDLVAEHKHNKESLYVECKAKEKVTSDELSKFAFNVGFKKIDKGYFYRTQEIESQAGALLREIKERPEYKNLTFFEPNDIIQMLIDGKMIFEPLSSLINFKISKKILAVTYLGDFLIYLINESSVLPTKFIIINANQNEKEVSKETIDILQKKITDISSLSIISNLIKYKKVDNNINKEKILETISEVQESENWYDYLPASADKNHFVGRDEIRTKILAYFKQIQEGKSSRRIFYLNGKSGWGKSSLVLELKDRCHNKHYKRKFFAIAIDTRSALSDNFVALSFQKIINSAITAGFIKKEIQEKISFSSTNDLLASESINLILQYLEDNNKFLVLIFDQFEDVFRKSDFFKTFYKFLTDVTDKKPNLIVGFSWKSDFFLQSDDSSYHLWQQAKEQAREFTISEFGEKETDGIIKQLEGSVGNLDKSIKERIKESSQGLPWLTKKLCIHIFDQINSGLAKEKLIESNLNIIDLFKKDEERLSPKEFIGLKIIAKKAFEGDFFDETEVGEIIDSDIISSLLHKRLIIRSGANYNIYWDIYRDYLVTGSIPIIGESYLLRQGVNLCLEVFLLFDKLETLDSLLEKHPKGISSETLYNILVELRNLGLIQKIDDNYTLNNDIITSKEGFVEFITNKFLNYTPYTYLKKLSQSRITKSDIIQSLKTIFKQNFQENTWDSYANTLISWFLMSNLDIKNRLVEPRKGRSSKNVLKSEDKLEMLPRASLKNILKELISLVDDSNNINRKHIRDLNLLDIIDSSLKITDFGEKLIISNLAEQKSLLKKKALSLPKMIKIKEHLDNDQRLTSKQLINLTPEDFFEGKKESSKLIYASSALSWLK